MEEKNNRKSKKTYMIIICLMGIFLTSIIITIAMINSKNINIAIISGIIFIFCLLGFFYSSKLNTKSVKYDNKKVALYVIIFLTISLSIIYGVWYFFMGRPESVLKSFIASCNSANATKLYDKVDWVGVYTLTNNEYIDYSEFWNKYNELKNSNEYREFKRNIDKNFKDRIDNIENFLYDYTINIKDIDYIVKEDKNLYVVKARFEVEYNKNEDKEVFTDRFLIIRNGLKCYLISGEVIEGTLLDKIIDYD